MDKIRKVSKVFRILFQITIIGLPIVLIWFWIYAPYPFESFPWFNISFIPYDIRILHDLMPLTKLFGFLVSLIPNGILLINLYFLLRIFKWFEQGEIFTLQNVKYMRNIGYMMLVGQALHPVYRALMSFVLTRNNPEGFRYIATGISSDNFETIFIALIIILISWILAEACKLREEQSLTV